MRQYTLRMCRSPEQEEKSNSCALHVLGYMMAVSRSKDGALIVDTPFVKLLRGYFLSLFGACYDTRKRRLRELRSIHRERKAMLKEDSPDRQKLYQKLYQRGQIKR